MGFASCGGHDNEEIKKLSETEEKDYTTEQMEAAVGYALEYQQMEIDALEEEISNVEETIINEKIQGIGGSIVAQATADGENDVKKNEAVKAKLDQIKENKAKIKELKKEKYNKLAEKAKELGFEKDAESYENQAKNVD